MRAFDAHTPIVVMTAWGSVGLAVEAMRRGAQDFIEKPWDNERLLSVLRTQVALGQSLHRARALEAENRQLTAAAARAHRRIAPRCSPCSRRSSASRRPTRTC